MSTKTNKKITLSEKKTTIIIIIAFIIIVLVGGYITFKFRDTDKNSIKKNMTDQTFTYSSELITLTSSNVMSKEDGINSNGYIIKIYNNTKEDIEYIILLKNDNVNCTCTSSIPTSFIRYSLNDNTIKTINEANQIIYKGIIKSKSNKKLNIKLWIDEGLEVSNKHYHGRFIVEKIEEKS